MDKILAIFLALQIAGITLLPLVKTHPQISEYRQSIIKKGKEEKGVFNLFKSVLWMTGGLIILKLIGFKLEWLIDLSVFFSGSVFGSLIGHPFLLGVLVLAYRKSGERWLYNISSALTILFFSLLISPFVTPEASMLLFALLSLYDVIGVLYFPYIKFLWLQVKKEVRTAGVAIISEEGMIGAGDFAMPLVFSLSYGIEGALAIPFLLLGFICTKKVSKKFRGFPGIPFQALFAYLFFLLNS